MELLIVIYVISVIFWCYIQYTDETIVTIKDFFNICFILFTFSPITNTFSMVVYFLLMLIEKLKVSEKWNKFLNIKIK